MAKPYYYVRFRWIGGLDIEALSSELSKKFQVERLDVPSGISDTTISRDQREELIVVADTLRARLSQTRAVLYQREAAPFTSKDIELRKIILDLYPRTTITPLPWFFSSEPKITVTG